MTNTTMMMSSQLALSSLVLLVVLGSHAVLGFSPSVVLHCSHASSSSSSSSDTTVQLNMFGNAFKDAFSNDDGLGARKNEGLSNGMYQGSQIPTIKCEQIMHNT